MLAAFSGGINFASDFDSVAVASGIYVENINFKGKTIKVAGAGSENTIIDGNQNEGVVTFEGENEGYAASDEAKLALLKGFTLQNGLDTAMTWPRGHGGGIFLTNSSPMLTDLIIQNNRSRFGSGGYFFNYHGTMDSVVIKNNIGMGLELQVPGAEIKNSVISKIVL